jgi:hypothetical protein
MSDALWSPISQTQAITDTDAGGHRYYVRTGSAEPDIYVVDGPSRNCLRTDPDKIGRQPPRAAWLLSNLGVASCQR